MSRPVGGVSWGQFAIVMAAVIAISSGGYAALRSEIARLVAEVDDLNKQVSGLREGVGAANGRLRTLIDEVQKRPQR